MPVLPFVYPLGVFYFLCPFYWCWEFTHCGTALPAHNDLSTITTPSLLPCEFRVGGAGRGSSRDFPGFTFLFILLKVNKEQNISSNFSEPMFCDLTSSRTGSCATNYKSNYIYFPAYYPSLAAPAAPGAGRVARGCYITFFLQTPYCFPLARMPCKSPRCFLGSVSPFQPENLDPFCPSLIQFFPLPWLYKRLLIALFAS